MEANMCERKNKQKRGQGLHVLFIEQCSFVVNQTAKISWITDLRIQKSLRFLFWVLNFNV